MTDRQNASMKFKGRVWIVGDNINTDLILPIGEWILEEACRQNRAWQDAGLPPVVVAVNISGVQFTRRSLPQTIGRVLAATGLDPQYLEVEVTETTIMSVGDNMVEKLDRIKNLGVQIALDDFGTGYSSLSYLSRFPIDTLKVDRAFVKDLPEDQGSEAIVAAVLALASSLGLKTTAEGVETDAQHRHLREAGCDVISSGVPKTVAEIEALMAA